MAEDPEIKTISKELIRLLKVNQISFSKVILFGSYAKGTQTKDSDIDFIIISKLFRNLDIFDRFSIVKNIKWSLTDKFVKPFDILYYSDIEWDKSTSIPVNEAKKYGIEIIDDF